MRNENPRKRKENPIIFLGDVNAPLPSEFTRLHDSNAGAFRPGRLWSLWDMLRVHAHEYIELGHMANQVSVVLYMADAGDNRGNLSSDERNNIESILRKMMRTCGDLSLDVSKGLIESRIGNVPQTHREFDLLYDEVLAEMKSKLFIYVPSLQAGYYEVLIPAVVADAFPLASKELSAAANSVAFDLGTACVFHSMRAAEIGVRALAARLEVAFDFDLKLAEWKNLLDQIERKIAEKQQSMKKGLQKDEELKFYSEAAAQFRYFKDAYRVRVAHSRATYDVMEAIKIFDHTRDFFVSLSLRLREPEGA